MKITKVSTILLEIPFEHGGPYRRIAGRLFDKLPILLVAISTDEGITGWGEPFVLSNPESARVALDTMIGPNLIGRDSGAIGATMLDLQRRLQYFGRSGPVMTGLSAVDIALWDLAGKRAGRPLHELLGGAFRSEIDAYSSLMTYGETATLATVIERAIQEGYRRIKLHQVAATEVKVAREVAGPDIELMLDVNCAWSAEEAIEAISDLRPYKLAWIEEPVWPPEDFRSLARVRKSCGVLIGAGENVSGPTEFHTMLEAGAVNIAQPSVTRGGGISEMRKSIAIADALGIRVRPHCAQLGPGFLATLHVTAALVPDAPIERLHLNLEADLLKQTTIARHGCIALPAGPGLGVDPDPEIIRRYSVR